MESDKALIGRIEDKAAQAEKGYYAVSTGFLDLHEQSVAQAWSRNHAAGEVRLFLYGGYPDADRRILIAAPKDLAGTLDEVLELDIWIAAIRVRKQPGARALTHRDYLGSVLALGLERSVIGDILVREDGADILIKPEMADFLLMEYGKAGRETLTAEKISLEDLIVPEQRTEELKFSVSSVRLDNLIAAAFGLSRSRAAEAVTRGLVSVDHIEITKTDKRIEEGSAIVLRGKGKVVFLGESGSTKKGKTVVKMIRYK